MQSIGLLSCEHLRADEFQEGVPKPVFALGRMQFAQTQEVLLVFLKFNWCQHSEHLIALGAAREAREDVALVNF